MLELTVNGESRTASPGTRLSELVSELGLDGRKIAIERNLEIVPKSQYEDVSLVTGDRIEIVQFVGGG